MSALLDGYASLPPLAANLIRVTRLQSSILVAVGVMLLFSRFRAADIFAKYAIRLLLAGGLCVAAALAIFGLLNAADQTTSGRAAGIVATAAAVAAAIFLYLFVGKQSDIFIERRIFGRRDARGTVRQFRDRLELLGSEEEVLLETQAAAAEYLGMQMDELFVRGRTDIENYAPGASVAIPRGATDGATVALVASPAGGKQTVLVGEIEMLREIAQHAGRRMDELNRERERIESARMESRLNEQLARAELIALRAQINPHFLFNSLNTVASLIGSQPKRAEGSQCASPVFSAMSCCTRICLLHR